MSDNPIPDVDQLSRFDGRRLIKEASDIFMHPYYREFLPDIEKILAVSKERAYYKDPHKHLGLQYGLLQLLQTVEKASSEGNRLARKQGDKELALQSKRNRYIAKAYKEIADGVAWRTLGYARFPMRILSQGRYSGHTWGKDAGQTTELKRAATAASNGAFVLVNDITNCLRVGDLVTLPTGRGGHIHLAEVKRNELITPYTISQKLNKGRALDVQEKRLIQAQLALDERFMPMRTQKVPVVSITPASVDVMAGAGAVMKRAMTDGIASKMVTPYLHVEAMDMAVLGELKDAEALKTLLNNIKQPEAEPISKYSSYDRMALTAAGEMVRSAPTYTIYPLPIKVITKLITGEMMLTATVYREPLEEVFRQLGWQFRFNKQAYDAYSPDDDKDLVKDFSGSLLVPYDASLTYNDMFLLRNPSTGFTMPVGDFVLQMATEFTNAQYVASIAAEVEAIAALEKPNPSLKYPDLVDYRRWN